MTPTASLRAIDRTGLLIVLGSAILFGIWPAATREIYAHGGNVVFVILVTTWTRALVMYLFCRIKRKPVFSGAIKGYGTMVGGLMQALSIFGLIGALVYLPGPVVIILFYCHVMMLLAVAIWRKKQALTLGIMAITLIALLGLSLAVGLWEQETDISLIGIALAMLAAIATTIRTEIYEHLSNTAHPIVVGAESFIVASLLVGLGLFYDLPTLPTDLSGYIWTAIGCFSLITGTFGVFYGIARMGGFRFSLFSKLEPVFTALFSWLISGIPLHASQYAGMAIVLGALVAYQTQKKN